MAEIVDLKGGLIGEGREIAALRILERMVKEIGDGLTVSQLVVVAVTSDGLDVRGSGGAPDSHWLLHKGAQMLLRSPSLDGTWIEPLP